MDYIRTPSKYTTGSCQNLNSYLLRNRSCGRLRSVVIMKIRSRIAWLEIIMKGITHSPKPGRRNLADTLRDGLLLTGYVALHTTESKVLRAANAEVFRKSQGYFLSRYAAAHAVPGTWFWLFCSLHTIPTRGDKRCGGIGSCSHGRRLDSIYCVMQQAFLNQAASMQICDGTTRALWLAEMGYSNERNRVELT